MSLENKAMDCKDGSWYCSISDKLVPPHGKIAYNNFLNIPVKIRKNMDCICDECIMKYHEFQIMKNKKALWVMVSPENQDFEAFKKFIEKKCNSKYIDSYWYTFEWRVKEIKYIGDKPLILPKGLHCHIFLYYNNRYAKQHFKSNRSKNFKMVSKIKYNCPKGIRINEWESQCREYCKWNGKHKIQKSEEWILKKKNDEIIRKFYKVPHFIEKQ